MPEYFPFENPADGIPAANYETVIVKTDLPVDHQFVEDDFA